MSTHRNNVANPRPLSKYRKALRDAFGPRKYRITATEEIHVRRMYGWVLYGWTGDRDTEYRLFEREA